MDIFNPDFRDFIAYLNKYNVDYMLVGGYAVIIRGYSRSTGDMDIWVSKTEDNFRKLLSATTAFGLRLPFRKTNSFLIDLTYSLSVSRLMQ
jgi:hypothetical protein